jgi:hypothetical protein
MVFNTFRTIEIDNATNSFIESEFSQINFTNSFYSIDYINNILKQNSDYYSIQMKKSIIFRKIDNRFLLNQTLSTKIIRPLLLKRIEKELLTK